MSGPAEARVVVDRLSKWFRDLRRGKVFAAQDISFEAKPGEVFALLGPNGAGKTTTLRMLCTVMKPSGGTARVAGFDVATQADRVRQHIGFMSMNTALYDRMSAWEIVAFFGRLHGLEPEPLRQRMEAIFAELRMNDFRDLLCARMSTGMRQKVSIARAIVHDPPVLVFDEPTTGLDVLVARAVLDSIDRLRAQGKCILYSTHIMREVERLCDRVAILRQGRVRAYGSIAELRDQFNQPDLEELFYALVK